MYYLSWLSLILLFNNSNTIVVQIPTLEQETEYVWRTIQDVSFFDEYGYDISLPKGELIEALLNKSRKNSLVDEDYVELSVFMRDIVYRQDDYEKGFIKVVSGIPLIESFISEIQNQKRNWEFKFFKRYTVTLTLYGPGGSYNSEEGSILLFTTADGGFKQYDNPANTIIHEIIHIGMESSIMQPFNVTHGLKERIIDTFVYLNFNDKLPDYRIQNMGDTRIDSYLLKKEDFKDLPEIIQSL